MLDEWMKDHPTSAHRGVCSSVPPPLRDNLDLHPSSPLRIQSATFRGKLSKLAPAHAGKFLCLNQLPQAEGKVQDPEGGRAMQAPGIKTQTSPVLRPTVNDPDSLDDLCIVTDTGYSHGSGVTVPKTRDIRGRHSSGLQDLVPTSVGLSQRLWQKLPGSKGRAKAELGFVVPANN